MASLMTPPAPSKLFRSYVAYNRETTSPSISSSISTNLSRTSSLTTSQRCTGYAPSSMPSSQAFVPRLLVWGSRKDDRSSLRPRGELRSSLGVVSLCLSRADHTPLGRGDQPRPLPHLQCLHRRKGQHPAWQLRRDLIHGPRPLVARRGVAVIDVGTLATMLMCARKSGVVGVEEWGILIRAAQNPSPLPMLRR
jgi:hypothetical protein